MTRLTIEKPSENPSTPEVADFDDILRQADEQTRLRPLWSRLHLLLPFGVLASAIALLAATGFLTSVGPAVVMAFFTIGKLIIPLGAVEGGFLGLGELQLALVVFCMDVFVGYFMAFNMHHLFKVRVCGIGPGMRRLQNYCRYWLEIQPWMKRWAFLGVALFVMFPLTGTGAPGGALLGRLVGLGPVTSLAAIAIGSVVGCSLMAAFAVPLRPVFDALSHSLAFKIGSVLLVAMLVVWFVRLSRRLSREAEAYAGARAAPPQGSAPTGSSDGDST